MRISTTCTVFAESEVLSWLGKGKKLDDILWGVHQSIASRSFGLLRRVGIEKEVTFTGGVAKNKAMVLDSGDANLNRWLRRSRNAFKDYRKQYGSDPTLVRNIVVFCDSNDSNSESLGYCGPITFSSKPLHPGQ